MMEVDELLMQTACSSAIKQHGMFKKPRPIRSGATMQQKVVVQHRSDMLLDEQVQNVKNVQDALKEAIEEMDRAKTAEETKFHQNQVNDLKERCDQMMVILKIVHKINIELEYARTDLRRILRVGGDVVAARKRVGWLEDRMEKLLGKKRDQEEDDRGGRRGGSGMNALDDPRMMMEGGKSGFMSDMSNMWGRGGFSQTSGQTSDMSPMHRPLQMPPGMPGLPDSSYPPGLMGIGPGMSSPSASGDSSARHNLPQQPPILKAPMEDDDSSGPQDTFITQYPASTFSPRVEHSMATTGSPLKLPQDIGSDGDDASPRDSEIQLDTKPEGSESGGPSPRDEPVSQRSKKSRVTIRSPADDVESMVPPSREQTGGPEEDAAADYWESEHHRFEYSDFYDDLLHIDPMSYHNMGIAIPGTFVEDPPDTASPSLPWRPKRRDSDVTDVHKAALDKLSGKIHRMYGRVKEASLLSVKDVEKQTKMPSLLQQQVEENASKENVDPGNQLVPVKKRPTSRESVTFPPLDKERLGSSMSGRLIYYPQPLPYPKNLPNTKTNWDKEFPRTSDHFSKSKPGKDAAPERIVNQRNLLKETKFTSSLYRSKAPNKDRANSSEKKFRQMLEDDEDISTKKTLRGVFNKVTAAIKLSDDEEEEEPKPRHRSKKTGPRWKDMKPKSGALEHSGLKWERIKSIVHNNLIGPNADERIDACKHLGALRCGDTMVMYALRERLKHDEDDRVVYEAAKALVSLGCWEQDVLFVMIHYLLNGNTDIRRDILKTMTKGKNVQYVDKSMKCFPDLVDILSVMCVNDNHEDQISFDAAVCLGRLCVNDDNAKKKLISLLDKKINTHMKAEALDILVRQLNYKERNVVNSVLEQMHRSPSWKDRKEAARLLILLGPKYVLADNNTETVYEILERRLWDDPNKDVRLEVAKVFAALDLFPVACERIEKKLEDPSESVRSQAIISVGTLGMKNERILRQLIEMVDLDSSEYVRLVIIRTFSVLNTSDKRVVRALKDKDKGDTPLARAARKTLQDLGVTPPSQKSPGKKG